jgi:transketolase
MRKVSLQQVHLLARKDPRVFFIGSDLGVGTLDEFRKEFPDRFFMEGISEAHVIGMAAGLALEGKIVYVNTIATFLTRRAYEQVCLDLCLHKLPVRLIGNGGGMVYAPLGPTHMATDDLAIMRALPNMTILAPADAREMAHLMPLTLECPGPVYVRVAKGGDPVVSAPQGPGAIGKSVLMHEGHDAMVVTTGVMLKAGLDAAELLAARGIGVRVVHVPTVKPLDGQALLQHAHEVKAIVTVEEHSVIGGLGSAVAELIVEAGFTTVKPFRRLGIPDMFPDDYGSQEHLLARFGLTADNVAATVTKLLSAR